MPVSPEGDLGPLEPNDDDIFDPPAAHPAAPSPGPTALSTAPPDEEPHSGDGSVEEAEGRITFTAFPEEHKLPFEGLCFVGKLEDDFTWAHHRFRIRTLTVDEHLEIALLISKYQGTLGEPKAYQTACVAACIVSLDGKPLPIPITNDDSMLGVRFDWVKRNWHSITIDAVYQRFVALDDKVHEIADAMGKASGQTVSLTPGS